MMGAVVLVFGGAAIGAGLLASAMIALFHGGGWAVAGLVLSLLGAALVNFGWLEIKEATRFREDEDRRRARMIRAGVPA